MSFNLSPILDKLFQSLPVRPIPKDVLDALVFKAIEEAQSYLSSEIRKAQWELLLRNKIYELAEKEESAMTDNVRYSQYYENLTDSLDIVLTFAEQGACENTAPFTVLEELLETQTIASCSHIFAWIEQRRNRLTVDMVPQKGKALILLRTLNDLLRRLSKTGDNTKFCGRILTFLSAVFPLGERSGVNLRGEYAAQWEVVTYPKSAKDEKMDVDEEPAKPPVESQSNDTVSTEQRQVAESSKGGKPSSSKVTLEKSEEVKEGVCLLL
jgi:THO complex subunit 1